MAMDVEAEKATELPILESLRIKLNVHVNHEGEQRALMT